MKLEKIEKELEKTLSPKRFRHSAGVAEMARHLAHLYGASEEKAYLAGWILCEGDDTLRNAACREESTSDI